MNNNIKLSGYLLKQGEDILAKWKKRWFVVLNSNVSEFHYYKNEDARKSLGYIDLQTVTSIVPDSRIKGNSGFHISTPKRTYSLQVLSERDMAYWIDGLNEIIASFSKGLSHYRERGSPAGSSAMPTLSPLDQIVKSKDSQIELLTKLLTEKEEEVKKLQREKEEEYRRSVKDKQEIDILNAELEKMKIRSKEDETQIDNLKKSLLGIMETSTTTTVTQQSDGTNIETRHNAVYDEYIKVAVEQATKPFIEKLASSSAKIMDLNKVISELKSNIGDLSLELEETKVKLADEKKSSSKAQKESNSKIESLNQTVQELENSMKELKEKHATLQAEATQEIEKRNKVIQQLKIEKEEDEGALVTLNKQIDQIENHIRGKLDEYNAMMKLNPLKTKDDFKREREARIALHEHNAFLGQEVTRFQSTIERRDATIKRLRTEIVKFTNENAGPVTPNTISLSEYSSLKHKYFHSIGRAVKLQALKEGWYANLDLNELYEDTLNRNIPMDEWELWVTFNFEEGHLPPPAVKKAST
eukprot:TRINITY_DN1698_c0_g1_i5.p1 TRINITY_DN1698_c0_g1~~TRINITY_DN1698_c0_g1_i5.p1  ORF type:complete len:528 (-),score=107.93 TRINITY_DN1698_c0_g1_i5:62-1645(-)